MSVEVWRNTGQSKFVLKVHQDENSRAEPLIVRGPVTFEISTEDRIRHGRDDVASDQYNHFKNGTFLPVTAAIETEGDALTASEQNPHHMSEDDMVELLNGNGNTLKASVRKMTAVPALQRLHALAVKDDEISDSKRKAIVARLDELGVSIPDKAQPTIGEMFNPELAGDEDE